MKISAPELLHGSKRDSYPFQWVTWALRAKEAEGRAHKKQHEKQEREMKSKQGGRRRPMTPGRGRPRRR